MAHRSGAGTGPTATAKLSILVISAYPDDRGSTADLRRIVGELSGSRGHSTETWFLRCMDHQTPWPGSRVVDELRTWAPAALLSSVGGERIAGFLRGRRLRSWLRRIDPDVVVLDDGLGQRLLDHVPRAPIRVVRLNPEPPADREMEPPASDRADLLLVHPDHHGPEPAARVRMAGAHLGHRPDARRLGSEPARRATRAALALPLDAPLVVGWGRDGWLDAPDVFVRTLWAVSRTHPDAHGLWLGLGDDVDELERLVSEAQRCHVGDRMHFREVMTQDARLCGDVVLLPDRSPGRAAEETIEAIMSGAPVVSFPMLAMHDDAIIVVPALDVEAAAAAIDHLLEDRSADARRERQRAAAFRLDVCGRIGELIDPSGHP